MVTLLGVHWNYSDLTVERGAPTSVGWVMVSFVAFAPLVEGVVSLCESSDVLHCVRLKVLAVGRRCRLSAIHILVLSVCILLNSELFDFGSIVMCCMSDRRLLVIRTLRPAVGSVRVM